MPKGLGGFRFLAVFVVIFAALQLVTVTSRHHVSDWLVAWPAQHTLGALYPGDRVRVTANRVESQRVRLNILPGCEGTELFVLLLAGVLAFPASLLAKLRGLAIGLPLAFALNQLRVVLLYGIVRDQPTLFELVHGFLAPTALVVALGLYFFCWSARAATDAAA